MAKTIVIKGADYSANSFDTVTLATEPCTSISLSKTSETTTAIGATVSLTATVTPVDTTDQVSWSSSNENIATVSNGVVTIVGVGTVVITATCGTRTATCTITAKAYMNGTNLKKVVGKYADGGGVSSGGNGLATLNSATRAGALLSSTGSNHFYSDNTSFPYVLPKNTGRIKITVGDGSNVTNLYRIVWFNSEVSAPGYSGNAETVVVEASAAFTNKVYEGAVPTAQGYTIDSVAFSVRCASDVTLVEADLTNITVEFLPAA